MHTKLTFEALCRHIEALGYSADVAARFARLIGDTPVIDGAGHVVVSDETGKELARLELARLNFNFE